MRAIWTGGISFGLVYIPVKLYSATPSNSGLDFDMLRKSDQCPIRFARVCKSTGEEVPWGEIVKGYQYRKGDYVILQDEDFERANPKRSKTLEIVDFVSREEVDPMFFEKPYFIEPTKEAAKTYVLLREALKKADKIGLTRYAFRSKEHIGALMVENDIIYLNQMRFKEELREPEDVDIPDHKISPKELDLALNLIDQMTAPFEPERYKDTTKEELLKIIDEKVKGKKPSKKTKTPEPTETNDLMKMLKASLASMKN
ncbi:MAG: Ku protein [Chitinophagales bacterium]|nr:Ku protein [Chitinophagales bacterium]